MTGIPLLIYCLGYERLIEQCTTDLGAKNDCNEVLALECGRCSEVGGKYYSQRQSEATHVLHRAINNNDTILFIYRQYKFANISVAIGRNYCDGSLLLHKENGEWCKNNG